MFERWSPQGGLTLLVLHPVNVVLIMCSFHLTASARIKATCIPPNFSSASVEDLFHRLVSCQRLLLGHCLHINHTYNYRAEFPFKGIMAGICKI